LGFEPRVLFEGAVDAGVTPALEAELLATLREALSNVARHARASKVEIEVSVTDELCLRVIDDGIGPPAEGAPAGNGLRNMATRSARLGGAFSLRSGTATGSVLEWRVPLSRA
jgi:signal transduction histidine kinase